MLERNQVVGGNDRGIRQSISDDERRSTRGLIAALDVFYELRHDMPARYISSFLLVMEEEGLAVSEYAQRAGVSNSVMSRHLLDIGDRDRHGNPGFMLVSAQRDPLELRRVRVRLTDKGRVIARRILRAWDR
jgi:DNA-binding MarR family transcriptional regulator